METLLDVYSSSWTLVAVPSGGGHCPGAGAESGAQAGAGLRALAIGSMDAEASVYHRLAGI